MPEGPFGLPRITSIGPFTEPSNVVPAHDTEPGGTYTFEEFSLAQPKTASDTREVLEMESQFNPEIKTVDVDNTMWHYHQVKTSDVIRGNTFTQNLLTLITVMEDEYSKAELMLRDTDMVSDVVEDEVYAHAQGEESVLNDELLRGTAASYTEFEQDNNTRVLKAVVEKISSDINKVYQISEQIKTHREYWPPSVEEELSDQSKLGFGTIDGSHRVVALSQVLGIPSEIYVWEWDN